MPCHGMAAWEAHGTGTVHCITGDMVSVTALLKQMRDKLRSLQ